MLDRITSVLGRDPHSLMAAVIVLFTALPVHEYAHAAMAVRLGDDTPLRQGRLTLNPFSHLSAFGSLALLFFGFGWANPVQVDTRNFKHPKRDMALCSAMGPLSNLAMALAAVVAYKISAGFIISYRMGGPAVTLANLFLQIMQLNLMLAVFNLLPIPPLDGSKLLSAFLPNRLYYLFHRYENVFMMVLVILLYAHLLDLPLGWLMGKLAGFLFFLTRPVDILIGLIG